jgi:signal transduction histidine kinase
MAAVQERQLLALELHESVTQVLYAAALMAESLPLNRELDLDDARRKTNQLVLMIRGAMAEMRTLLIELRPDTIVRSKLPDLLKQLGEAAQARVTVQLILDLEPSVEPLPVAVHIAIYRIAQESVTNVVKHSQATQLRIHLHYQPEQLTLQVKDNGKGFDTKLLSPGLGQITLRERAKAINAALTIDSQPGKGTSITLVWKMSTSTHIL